jgi:hypothetical protein
VKAKCKFTLLQKKLKSFMTITDFNALAHFEQEEFLRQEPTSIKGFREFGEYQIHYYFLPDFAVEVYVFKETGSISRFKAIPTEHVRYES